MGAVERGAGVGVGGLVVAVHTEGGEELSQHAGGVLGSSGLNWSCPRPGS